MLLKAAKLGTEEDRVIRAIGEMYKSLKFKLSHLSRWEGALRRTAFARAIQGSNSIEGYRVTVEDALAAAEGEEPLEATQEIWQAIVGYRNAMTYILQLCKDPDFTMSEDVLRSLHFMMIHYDLSKHPGNWRPGPIYVRDEETGLNVYEGPPAEEARRLVKELITYINGPEDHEHALVKAAMAHLNLVMIHPFSDGNGRMARCLHTFVVASRATADPIFSSIEEYLGRRGNTRAYYNVLAQVAQGSWHPQNDTRPWIRFTLTAHYRQAATFLKRNRLLAKIWDELERATKTAKLPDRCLLALSDAASGFRVRSAHYGHLADVSRVVASRDLKAMVEAGFLVPEGEKRGRIYRASDSLREMALKLRREEPAEIPDPFESGELLSG